MIIRPDMIIGISTFLFGAAYVAQAYALPKASIGAPMAPIYFPLGLGVLTIAIGIILMITAFNDKSVPKKKKTKDPHYVRLMVVTAALGVGYGVILEEVGFLISTLAFLGGLLFLVNGAKAWKLNSIVTVVFTVGIWYVFEQVLSITLP